MVRALIAAAVVAITALTIITVPNVITARNRSRQKRTMADVRDWAAALETVDRHNGLSAAGTSHDPVLGKLPLPRTDAWGTPYRIRFSNGTFTVTSAGRDGVFQLSAGNGATRDFDDDIINTDGDFVQYPEGI